MKARVKNTMLGMALALTAALAIMPASASASPYCGITWGSLPKSNTNSTTRSLTNIRTGQHACFDRMVFDLSGSGGTGYYVSYVPDVYAEGSGQLIHLNGGAKLQVVVRAPVYNTSGVVTYNATVDQTLPGVNLTNYQTFRDAKYAGSFEGQTTVGLGVRATLPFRVFSFGNHVVVDVAHYW